jgi:hypothetical protein
LPQPNKSANLLKYLAKHLKVILPAIIDTFDLKKDRLIIKILYYKIVFWASKFAFFARRRPTMVGGASGAASCSTCKKKPQSPDT